MAKHTGVCTCGGTLVRDTWPGQEYVHNELVYELDESLSLDRCSSCGEIWTSLADCQKIRKFVNERNPIRKMTRKEYENYWDAWLAKRGSEPLYRLGSTRYNHGV